MSGGEVDLHRSSVAKPARNAYHTRRMPFSPLLPLRGVVAACAVAFAGSLAMAQDAQPPAGFTALFNGKDLSGWRGGDTFDHRKLLAMPEGERAKQIEEWTKSMREHWRAEGGELINDGHGKYATTEKDYGDFELLVEYKTVPKADSGIYLRGVPQVQIWDVNDSDEGGKLGRAKGSGGLWNNSPGAPGKDPLVKADKPLGEWNRFRIVMAGSRVSVWLNDQQVVDHAILENYYDRKTPVPARGPIQLQTHGGEIRWRNIFLREIGSEEANKILSGKSADAFKSIFNGRDFAGWAGPVDNYEVKDGALVCKPGKGGTIYHNEELSDFVARLEFKVPPGGNNGLAIRYPGEGDTAYAGMCELQVLDENYDQVRGKLDPRQVHGSAYGMAAAQRGYQHPTGEWNFQEVTVKGPTIKVELNGTVILDADLSKADPATFMGGKPHPGLNRTNGFFGFAGHNDLVAFRNVSVKKL